MVRGERVCPERLPSRLKYLDSEHASPFCLVAVGHDYNSGTLVICVTENETSLDIAGWLPALQGRLRAALAQGYSPPRTASCVWPAGKPPEHLSRFRHQIT